MLQCPLCNTLLSWTKMLNIKYVFLIYILFTHDNTNKVKTEKLSWINSSSQHEFCEGRQLCKSNSFWLLPTFAIKLHLLRDVVRVPCSAFILNESPVYFNYQISFPKPTYWLQPTSFRSHYQTSAISSPVTPSLMHGCFKQDWWWAIKVFEQSCINDLG